MTSESSPETSPQPEFNLPAKLESKLEPPPVFEELPPKKEEPPPKKMIMSLLKYMGVGGVGLAIAGTIINIFSSSFRRDDSKDIFNIAGAKRVEVGGDLKVTLQQCPNGFLVLDFQPREGKTQYIMRISEDKTNFFIDTLNTQQVDKNTFVYKLDTNRATLHFMIQEGD